jgi:hypothetical protein
MNRTATFITTTARDASRSVHRFAIQHPRGTMSLLPCWIQTRLSSPMDMECHLHESTSPLTVANIGLTFVGVTLIAMIFWKLYRDYEFPRRLVIGAATVWLIKILLSYMPA